MQTPAPSEPEFLSIQQVADRLGLCWRTVWRACRSGEIPSTRVRRRILIARATVDRMTAADAPPARLAA